MIVLSSLKYALILAINSYTIYIKFEKDVHNILTFIFKTLEIKFVTIYDYIKSYNYVSNIISKNIHQNR